MVEKNDSDNNGIFFHIKIITSSNEKIGYI